MTSLDDLPFDYPSTPTNNGAKGRQGKCRRHDWVTCGPDYRPDSPYGRPEDAGRNRCQFCLTFRDSAASRRGRTNRSRGNRAELAIAREIPGARKMGPLGLPWDVEVGEYARLQVKKLAHKPSPNAIRKLIEAIPDTGDRLRGFVWVEAAGQGKRGQRTVWFLLSEWRHWHGVGYGFAAGQLREMPLVDWIAEFVGDNHRGVVAEAGG